VKPPLRTKSVGTKVSEAEFALLEERARAAGMRLAEWVREVLLGTGRPSGVGSEAPDTASSALAGEVALAEVLALRSLFLNLQFRAARGEAGQSPLTEEEMRGLIERADGHICAARSSAGVTGYVYNAEGERVEKGSITSMSCDPTTNGFRPQNDYILGLGGEQLTEMTANSDGVMAWQNTNVYAAGALMATYDAEGLHFLLNDMLGTRRAQTNYAGVLEQSCSSLPFGDQLNCSSSLQAPNPLHFTGKERDSESGLDYFGARYYGSSIGRWMSPNWSEKQEPVPYSKLDDPQTLNLYTYGLNNPLSFVDDDGHFSRDTYVADVSKHGGSHVDRYSGKQNVGRYRPDGTPIKHGGKTPDPVPNADRGKFDEAVKDLNKQVDANAQKMIDDQLKNHPLPGSPPLPDHLKPTPTPAPSPVPPVTPIPLPSPGPMPSPTPPLPIPEPMPMPMPMPEPIPFPILIAHPH
jgi:RHS repeat-associated protein